MPIPKSGITGFWMIVRCCSKLQNCGLTRCGHDSNSACAIAVACKSGSLPSKYSRILDIFETLGCPTERRCFHTRSKSPTIQVKSSIQTPRSTTTPFKPWLPAIIASLTCRASHQDPGHKSPSQKLILTEEY